MININDIKNGMTVKIEGKLYQIIEFQHVKPGKGPAFVRIKLKNLRTGANIDQTYNSNIKVEKANIDKQEMQFLYKNGETYYFMNMETYEQLELSKDQIGEDANYLKDGLNVSISFYEGELLGLVLPDKVELKIVRTDAAIRGNTTSNASKEALTETGLTVKVPLFIGEDEVIIVSTRDGSYDGRA